MKNQAIKDDRLIKELKDDIIKRTKGIKDSRKRQTANRKIVKQCDKIFANVNKLLSEGAFLTTPQNFQERINERLKVMRDEFFNNADGNIPLSIRIENEIPDLNKWIEEGERRSRVVRYYLRNGELPEEMRDIPLIPHAWWLVNTIARVIFVDELKKKYKLIK